MTCDQGGQALLLCGSGIGNNPGELRMAWVGQTCRHRRGSGFRALLCQPTPSQWYQIIILSKAINNKYLLLWLMWMKTFTISLILCESCSCQIIVFSGFWSIELQESNSNFTVLSITINEYYYPCGGNGFWPSYLECYIWYLTHDYGKMVSLINHFIDNYKGILFLARIWLI